MSRRAKGVPFLAVVGIVILVIVVGYVFAPVISSWLSGVGVPQVTVYTAPDGTDFSNYNAYLDYMRTYFPGEQPEGQVITPVERDAAQIQFTIVDYVQRGAGMTTATTYLDVCKAEASGKFDLMNNDDAVTVATAVDQSASFYAEGDKLLLKAACSGNPTGGLDYVDGWHYVVLKEGNPIYMVDGEDAFSGSAGAYTINTAGLETTGYVVTYTSGTTNYWDVGKLFVYPRLSAANFDTYLSYGVTTLASVTDGSTWVDTVGEITANATLSSALNTEKLTFTMKGGAANVGWGMPLLVVSSSGKIEQHDAMLIMSTAMTAIGTQKLLDAGWKQIQDNTLYAEKAFYYDLTENMDGQMPAKGQILEFSVNIPFDPSAAAVATAFLTKVWAIDIQNPDNVAIGSSTTTVLTAQGMVTAYGPGAMIQASAYTASSGAGSGRILQAYITTAS